MSDSTSESTQAIQPPHMDDATRSRTFTWHDPSLTAEASKTMSGLDFLRAIAAGTLPPPPIVAMMNMRVAEVAEGRVVFAIEPAEYHYNPIGSVHGGVAATLLDSAMGCAVHSMLPAGVGYTTL
ncbi:MAG: PaaI family thioesterase, partial [Ktedonobacterales bacterium]